MLQPNIAEEVLARATATGADFGEIYLEDQTGQNINLRSGKIEAVTSGRSHGAGVRIFVGNQAVYVYTNDTSREGLLACADKAAAAVNGGTGCKPAPFRIVHAERPEAVFEGQTDNPVSFRADPSRRETFFGGSAFPVREKDSKIFIKSFTTIVPVVDEKRSLSPLLSLLVNQDRLFRLPTCSQEEKGL